MEMVPGQSGGEHRESGDPRSGAEATTCGGFGTTAGDAALGGKEPAAELQATGGGRWRRRVATLVAFVVLVVVGREVRPAVSRASAPDAGTIELGSLVSRASRLEMALRQGEMRFRVIDAEGKVLAADLSEAQLAARFPRLDLRNLHAQQLMLAEPGDER